MTAGKGVNAKNLSDTEIARAIARATKGSKDCAAAKKNVENAFHPKPRLVLVKMRGAFQADVTACFADGSRHGTTCDL